MPSKSKLFLFCCLAFGGGIAVASYLPDKLSEKGLWWFACAVACAVVALLLNGNKRAPIRFYFLLLLFVFLGIWRYAASIPANAVGKIQYYNGQSVVVAGIVEEELDERRDNTRLEIGAVKVCSEGKRAKTESTRRGLCFNASGRLLAIIDHYPHYEYGDTLEIKCELREPEPFDGFAYDRYLARRGIYSLCYYPEIKIINSAEQKQSLKIRLYKKIYSFKNKLRQTIIYGLSGEEANLARAVVLGDKSSLPEDLRQNFSRVGISHIIAISGLHIGIIAVLLMSLLIYIGFYRQKTFWPIAAILIFYVFIIGFPASAVRAVIMALMALWAVKIGRLNSLANGLIFAAAAMLLFNPKLLRDDVSFQLSFLAIAGIIYVYPAVSDWLDKIKIINHKAVKDIFSVTIAAQAFTLPVVAYNFSIISLAAPIANSLVLWALPLLIILIIIAVLLSLILPGMIQLFFLPARLLLKYIISVAEYSSKLPYAYLEINPQSMGWLCGLAVYYIILAYLLFIGKKDKI